MQVYLGSIPTTANDGENSETRRQTVLSLGQVVLDENTILSNLDIYVTAADLQTAWDSPMHLSKFSKFLTQDAVVQVHVDNCEGQADLQPIHTAFLLAGLLATAERRQNGSRVLSATKRPAEHKDRMQATSITLLSEDDLIDEDALLSDTSNLLAPPPAMSAAASKTTDDCSGRKACDNCSCGRADTEKSNGGEQKQQPVAKSSCGKCHLGDAFRCASCPYLGKPAFKPGEEHLYLDLQDDL